MVLVDGQINAGWTVQTRKHVARLEIEAYRRIGKRETAELEREGLAFLKFLRPEAKSWDVTFTSGN